MAILSDKVDRCVSFDGQGFSNEFCEKYKEEIEKNSYKITSISAYTDPVNALLNPIAKNIKYIKNTIPHMGRYKRKSTRNNARYC